MQSIIILLIRFYQKFISPYKGFRCAYAVLHQGDSCSFAIKQLIERHGVFRGLALAKNQFQSCKQAYFELTEDKKKKDNKWHDFCCMGTDCDVLNCAPKKSCDLPELPCDCSLF